jgi:hypothetical protein
MKRPTLLRAVRWKVAGEYAYKGDLVIVDKVLFYFPHTDLIEERIDKTAIAVMLIFCSCGIALIYRFIAPMLVDPIRGRYTASTKELIQMIESVGDDSKRIRERLSGYIAKLKEENAGSRRALTMPLPVQYTIEDITRVSVSLLGKLEFEAKYGAEQFNVGLINKGALTKALTEEGFIS